MIIFGFLYRIVYRYFFEALIFKNIINVCWFKPSLNISLTLKVFLSPLRSSNFKITLSPFCFTDAFFNVLTGDFAGCRVEEMALEQLIDLLRVCRQDEKESARLIEAFLDREFDNWRERAKSRDRRAPVPGGNMERAEALQVLGLQEGASEFDIREAHRHLIAGMHPDHGGSDYLAAQINHAKDVLLE